MSIPNLEELSKLPKEVDGIRLEDCNIITQTSDKYRYKAIIAEKDGHYYMFEDNQRFRADQPQLHHLLVPTDCTYGKCIREIYPDEKKDEFYYTPDDCHRYSVRYYKQSGYCAAPYVFTRDPKEIAHGESCTYKGIKLTYLTSGVKIEKDSVERCIQVKEDTNFVYKVLKREIKAKHGAAGLYAFFENIAEQAKTDRPVLADAFFVLEKTLHDPKNPGIKVGSPIVNGKPSEKAYLPPEEYTLVINSEDNALWFEKYASPEKAIEDGERILANGYDGYALRYDFTNKIIAEGGKSPASRITLSDIYELKVYADGKIQDDIVRTELDKIKDRAASIANSCSGYAIFNKTSKIIEEIGGNFPLEKAFDKRVLSVNGLYEEPTETKSDKSKKIER